MVFWRSKKHDNGKVSHFKHKNIKRISEDVDEEKILSILDAEDILEIVDDIDVSKFKDGNYRSEESEPVEDLSAEQRRNVEDIIGSPIVLIRDDHLHKPAFIFANNEEWVVYKSPEQVDKDIKSILEHQLRDFPEMFDQQWLDNLRIIKMSEENRTIKSNEEAHRIVDHAGKLELFGLAKSFGIPIEKSSNEPELRRNVFDGIQKELKHQLQDPVQYYVELEGRYSESQLAKMPWVETKIDYDNAIKDAIDMDGRAHFLSTVDGREIKLHDMYLYRLK